MKKNLFFCLALLTYPSYFSCENYIEKDGSVGPPGPSLSGNLSGYVRLVDINGKSQIFIDTVTVLIEGTSKSTKCDSNGRWSFEGLKSGTYTLLFMKNGYGTYKRIGFQFIGGGDVFFGIVQLGQLPNHWVTALSATYSAGQVNVSGTISMTPPSINDNYCLFVYIGIDSLVSSNPSHYLLVEDSYVGYPFTSFSFSIMREDLLVAGIKAGSKVYFKGYGSSHFSIYYGGYEGGSYLDPMTGRFIYTCLSTQSSPLASVTIP